MGTLNIWTKGESDRRNGDVKYYSFPSPCLPAKVKWLALIGLILMMVSSAKESPSIPDDIIYALEETFYYDDDSYARILYFLSDNLAKGEHFAQPYINALQIVIDNTNSFKRVAEQMVDDTKKAETDPKFREIMHNIYDNFLKNGLSVKTTDGQDWALAVPENSVGASTQYTFMRIVARLPPKTFLAMKHVINSLPVVGREASNALAAARSGQSVARVPLLTAYLSYDTFINIRRWWNGEISGTRCVKNIVDSGVSVAGGVAGGVGGEMAGATIGGVFGGPVGATVGAFVGGIFGALGGAIGAQTLSDRLTQWSFGLPKSEALENAYNFLGVSQTADNSVINSSYRLLARLYHPDKRGDQEKWMQLQLSMAIIKEARGEHY